MWNMRSHTIKAGAFFIRNFRMTRRNAFTLFEVLFWPAVGLASVGLLTRFLALDADTTAFVLTGTIALSVVQVCQLDVAYGLLFDVWSKSVKHQFLAPIGVGHLVAGSWAMGAVRGALAFLVMASFGAWAFGFDFFKAGLLPLVLFLLGCLLSAAGVGVLTCILLLLFGYRAEVAAWSLVSMLMVLCGVYYPVDLLPAPLAAAGRLLPLTGILEGFRAGYGFAPATASPWGEGLALGVGYLLAGGFTLHWAARSARRSGMLLRLSE
ncbi:MAG: ABC transporter permease [candidate division NC10 bacterium]|nr:ABC transporter permease [candidate division NC10 bacterium]